PSRSQSAWWQAPTSLHRVPCRFRPRSGRGSWFRRHQRRDTSYLLFPWKVNAKVSLRVLPKPLAVPIKSCTGFASRVRDCRSRINTMGHADSSSLTIAAQHIFDGADMRGPGAVRISQGRIESVSFGEAAARASIHTPTDAILAPGFIDI